MMTVNFYAALCGVILMGLSYWVIMLRNRKHALVCGTEDTELLKAIHIQANFVRYVPLGLLLMTFFELAGGSQAAIHAAGIGLIVARMFYAWGISAQIAASTTRMLSVGVSWVVLGGLSSYIGYASIIS
jgi:uncharacterized membrane protein YecN with MAPEG domain